MCTKPSVAAGQVTLAGLRALKTQGNVILTTSVDVARGTCTVSAQGSTGQSVLIGRLPPCAVPEALMGAGYVRVVAPPLTSPASTITTYAIIPDALWTLMKSRDGMSVLVSLDFAASSLDVGAAPLASPFVYTPLQGAIKNDIVNAVKAAGYARTTPPVNPPVNPPGVHADTTKDKVRLGFAIGMGVLAAGLMAALIGVSVKRSGKGQWRDRQQRGRQ